jgi:peptidoglycan/xylan/chitin deacetylase (PgdA/CDA1 family)
MAIILTYHRICEAVTAYDPWHLSVARAQFLAQMELVAHHYTVVSLDELGSRLDAGASVEGSIAITFDDGYFNNLRLAKPVLERLGLPATCFVATGFIGRAAFWWDTQSPAH